MENLTSLGPGDVVLATTADGQEVRMRAVRAPEAGRDFPVIWLATEEEYRRALAASDEADAIPWPLDSVRECVSA
jgi:hypothetical protein